MKIQHEVGRSGSHEVHLPGVKTAVNPDGPRRRMPARIPGDPTCPACGYPVHMGPEDTLMGTIRCPGCGVEYRVTAHDPPPRRVHRLSDADAAWAAVPQPFDEYLAPCSPPPEKPPPYCDDRGRRRLPRHMRRFGPLVPVIAALLAGAAVLLASARGLF